MFTKRKRSTRRWSVRAIEFMIVLVAMVATASFIFPTPEVTEIRVLESPQVVEVVEDTDTSDLVAASYDAALDYMRVEDYATSASLLDAITTVADDHYWSHVSYSFVLYEMGQYEEALAVATEGITINPHDPTSWNNRCLLHALLGNYEQGLSDCDNSIIVGPEYDYSHNNRCYILTELGRLAEAEQSCNQALDNGHRMPEWVHTNLGRIALKRGLDNPALEQFMTALEYNPQHADAYAGLGDTMLIKANFTKALEFYELYQLHAGVHYDPDRVNVKIAYAKDAIAFLGQN